MNKLNNRLKKLEEQEQANDDTLLVIGEGEEPTKEQLRCSDNTGIPILEVDVL